MVVTHLEMHAPAETRPVPEPGNLSFQRLTPPGVGIYRDLFYRVDGHDWLWSSRIELSDADLQALLSDTQVDVYTLLLDGTPEALLELDFREENACELAFFGLTKSLIGTGAGRYLMNQAIRLAWARPITRFHVHTCTLDSPGALAFYQRSGFVPVRQEIEIADDPRCTGILPESAGPHAPIFRGR
ncbi:GNAT family N-acetyltransferase [Thalassococcus sp. S3]|nr:GNAT family N-acetyltransferase [Thalassococcus sp. S3]QBF33122.1 GNAT family N-acetyltransferase [Thalassococcus sp. S3]